MTFTFPDKLTAPLAQRRLLHFLLILLVAGSFAFYTSRVLPKGAVWASHQAAGLLLVKGSLPSLPAYPMWGYSLLAGLFGETITLLQGALMLVVCSCWYRSILGSATASHHRNTLAHIVHNPIVVATLLLPFVFLSLSYYSNSMAYILVLGAVWLLHLAVERGRDRRIGLYAASGLLFGLGFNVRSELLLLGILLGVALCAYGIVTHGKAYYLKMAMVFLASLLLASVPWMAYTRATVKQPLLSSTNGGGVMYLGLGVLRNNPWKVMNSDQYVGRLADDNNLGGRWSAEANEYFKRLYLEAIREHPSSFAKRVLVGWRQMLMQGVYVPNIRAAFTLGNDREAMLCDVVNERLKRAFGLNVNEEQLEEYGRMGISDSDLSFRHYAIVVLEYVVRCVYLGIFLALLGACLVLSVKTKYHEWMSYVCTAHVVFVLCVAGFIQTLPRHTTVLVPTLIYTISVLLRKPTREETG